MGNSQRFSALYIYIYILVASVTPEMYMNVCSGLYCVHMSEKSHHPGITFIFSDLNKHLVFIATIQSSAT